MGGNGRYGHAGQVGWEIPRTILRSERNRRSGHLPEIPHGFAQECAPSSASSAERGVVFPWALVCQGILVAFHGAGNGFMPVALGQRKDAAEQGVQADEARLELERGMALCKSCGCAVIVHGPGGARASQLNAGVRQT
jgi:hypothetical protein